MIGSVMQKTAKYLLRVPRKSPILSKVGHILGANRLNISKFQGKQIAFGFCDSVQQNQQQSTGSQMDRQMKKFFEECEILKEQRKYAEAQERWERMKSSEKGQNSVIALECDFQIAGLHLANGRVSDAVKQFHAYLETFSATNSNSTNAASLEALEIAQEFTNYQCYEESIAFFKKSFTYSPKESVPSESSILVKAHRMYAEMLLVNLNKPKEAIAHVREHCIELDASGSALLLGEAYFMLRDYSSCVKAYRQLLEVLEKKRLEQVVSKADSKQVSMQEIASVQLKLASAHYFAGELKEALANYMEGKRFCVENKLDISHQMFLNIAELYLKLGDVSASLANLDEGGKMHPNRVEFAYVAGMITNTRLEQNDGNRESAKNFFKKAIEIDGNHANAHKQLALIHLRSSEYEQAEEMFLRCIQLNRNDVDALYYTGYILQYHHNSPLDAIICYQLCLDIQSEHPIALMQMGIVHAEMKQIDKAVEYLSRAAKADPTSQPIKQILEKIQMKASA